MIELQLDLGFHFTDYSRIQYTRIHFDGRMVCAHMHCILAAVRKCQFASTPNEGVQEDRMEILHTEFNEVNSF